MVNGVLDRIARDVRAAEFAGADDTDNTDDTG